MGGFCDVSELEYTRGTTGFIVEYDPVPVSSVQLSQTKVLMTINSSQKVTATVSPANATNKEVVWTTSDSSVVEVYDDGVITAKKLGKATITATSGEKSASLFVTVDYNFPKSSDYRKAS